MNRRDFLTTSAAATLLARSVPRASAAEFERPVFNLHKHFPAPVKIAAIDLLQSGKQFFVRTRSTDGLEGIVLTKDMEDFIPILHRRVIPHFLVCPVRLSHQAERSLHRRRFLGVRLRDLWRDRRPRDRARRRLG